MSVAILLHIGGNYKKQLLFITKITVKCHENLPVTSNTYGLYITLHKIGFNFKSRLVPNNWVFPIIIFPHKKCGEALLTEPKTLQLS